MKHHRWLILSLLGAVLFIATSHQNWRTGAIEYPPLLTDRVVISAPLQVLMYGGDRFLAANLEAMRLATLASTSHDDDTSHYLIRAHRLVAELNACHEDNYYLGNVLLSWAGAEEEGDRILLQATECRHWDWAPPFFYAINQYFFRRNVKEAQKALNIAAARSPDNAAVFKKNAVMMAARELDDEQLALNYLRQQYDQTTDTKLKTMLQKRVIRLEGLLALRGAQRLYEQQSGHKLTAPQELLTGGYMEQFPTDPLGLGYQFNDGIFQLKQLHFPGMEQ